ncbi:hypothetical protein PCASD_17375 [Puccinia coronata f. sp. avenae]|uniref:Hydrophobin n=1 Tax=Puccinia coronata f. sp. avenae TaxID=200324 RepID=A0A2N5SNW5_9BASI|nr:hypothetical protein PCASD_17375 [Puccinia coronata f. sp. avenae]
MLFPSASTIVATLMLVGRAATFQCHDSAHPTYTLGVCAAKDSDPKGQYISVSRATISGGQNLCPSERPNAGCCLQSLGQFLAGGTKPKTISTNTLFGSCL